MNIVLGKYNLIIPQEILIFLKSYRQTGCKNECGGIIFATKQKDYDIYTIESCSEPNSDDLSNRFSFVRNKKRAQKLINKKWKNSNGEINYIGEWHSHPENIPTPSITDKTLWENIFVDKSSKFGITINIIVGIEKFYIRITDEKKNIIEGEQSYE